MARVQFPSFRFRRDPLIAALLLLGSLGFHLLAGADPARREEPASGAAPMNPRLAQAPPPADPSSGEPSKSPPIQLPGVTVPGLVEQSYNPSTATTGSKVDLPLRDVPQSIQVVPRQVIDDQRALSLPDVLRNVSGFSPSINSQSQRFGDRNIIFRGFTTNNFSPSAGR